MADPAQRYSLLHEELVREEGRLKQLDDERKTTLANIQRILSRYGYGTLMKA